MNSLLKKIKEKPIYEYILAVLFFITVSVIFAQTSGILDSGYHFTDDHEIIDICNNINKYGFIKAMNIAVAEDLVWRYRPLFFVVRALRSFLFGTNFFYWHLSVAIECGLTMACSYILARKMKANVIVSLLFSFIFFVGSQDETIWRMGTNENMGMFFLSLSFLLTYCYYEKNNNLYKISSIISIILMTLCKESFLLMVPALFVFLFYLFLLSSDEDSILINLKCFINKYKTYIIVSSVSVLIGMLVIILYVGLLRNDYAGIDTSYNFYEYIRITLNVFIRDLKDYWYIFGIIFIIFVSSIVIRIKNSNLNKKTIVIALTAIAFFGISMCVQAVLYAKSAMFDRYKLPLLWVLYFVLMVMQNNSIKKSLHSAVVILVCVYMMIFCYKNDYRLFNDGKNYAKEGKATTKMLDYVGELNEQKNGITILTDYYWYEHNYSSSAYLQVEKNIDNVFYYDDEKENGNYKKIYNLSQERIGIEDADVILTDSNLVENYNLDNYDIKEYSWFYVLIKK